MSATIFYYTGTGNSLWVARKLADALGNADVVSMSGHWDETKRIDPGATGLVFPVYIWGVPAPVLRFVKNMKVVPDSYIFAIAVNGGQVSNTLVQLKGIMAQNRLNLSAGFQIKMPSNYIPWGGPGPTEEQQKLFDLAQKKVMRIAESIKGKVSLPVEKGPLWQRIIFTAIYRMSFSQVPKMDRQFWSDNKPMADLNGTTNASSALPACSGARRRRSNTVKRPPAMSGIINRKSFLRMS
jgi:hypothetical protein